MTRQYVMFWNGFFKWVYKPLCLTSITLLIHTFVFSQATSYLPYYELSRRADIYLCEGKYKDALNCYQKAFTRVDDPRSLQLHDAIVCCAILNEPDSMFSYMKTVMKQGRWSIIYDTSEYFAPYRKMPEWEALQQNKENYFREYEAGLNVEYKNLLDSLDREDQMIRKKKRYWPDHFPKSEKPKDDKAGLRYVDSCNMISFYQWYQKFGYPSTRNIGQIVGSPGIGYLCLHHQVDSIFMEVQYQAVRDGKIPLHTMDFKVRYANGWQYPCRNDVDTLLLAYYVLIPQNQNEHDLINSFRRERGFPSLEEEIDLIIKSDLRGRLLSHSHWEYNMIRKKHEKEAKKKGGNKKD